jgi:hypothetical protein
MHLSARYTEEARKGDGEVTGGLSVAYSIHYLRYFLSKFIRISSPGIAMKKERKSRNRD